MITKEERDKKVQSTINKAMIAALEVMYPEGTIRAPEILWHYTDANSLESILKTKSMYATQFNYLNDPSEIRLFGSIAQHIATDRLKKLPVLEGDDLVETPEQYKTAWWHIVRDSDKMFIFDPICVTCFSEIGDLLGQWRAYADDCKGYAIGLSFEWLKNQTISLEYPFRLLRVIYEPKKQFELVSKLLDVTIDDVSSIMAEVGEKDLEDTLSLMTSLFQRLTAEFSPGIKHPTYSDEREWRLLSLKGHMDVCATKGNFVQFVVINLDNPERNHPFRTIKLGPKNNYKIEKPAIKLLLKKLGLENDIKLSRSVIPMKIT